METRMLPVGIEDFVEMRTDNFYYVDKTSFMTTLLRNRGKASLFTRPRRFGKTLTMSMLKAFFEIDRNHEELFTGLEIAEEIALCAEHMNRYPVIFLTLKSVEAEDFAGALARIGVQIANECGRLSFLAQSSGGAPRDLRDFEALLMRTATPQQLEDSLRTLTRLLEAHYGQKVVLLIDEYDVPLDKAFHKGYYDKMISFMRLFLGEALKTNEALKFAVVTGCLRISRESIFTGLNNIRTNTITSKLHSEHFGFTDSEVRKMLDEYNLSSSYGDLRAWYNGYRFGDSDVYCPWDIINHASELLANPNIRPRCYWNNTSSNNMVQLFIDKADDTTRNEIEDLIAGKSVAKVITENLTYGELDDTIDNLWSVLFLTGYLTRTQDPMGLQSEPVNLVIPNLEIREIFIEKIRKWFMERLNNARIQEDLCRLYRALLDGDCETIEEVLHDQLRATISYFDNYENYYHGFLTGLLLGGAWSLKSNRESGDGRSDLILVASDGSAGIVIEIKHAKKAEDIPVMCELALAQIDKKRYQDAFLVNRVKQIRVYGITFWKKTCGVIAAPVIDTRGG
ncbi:MAG: ATP-binding protein [Peptococcaceae bacterium]|nr:ATP-binding protein [Peptococcaceae bacterium]